MKSSIKYFLAGLAGAGVFTVATISASHRIHEYERIKNELQQEVQVADNNVKYLDQKVNECIKTAHDCRSAYAQYKTAVDEYQTIKKEFDSLEKNPEYAAPWEPLLGAVGLVAALAGLPLGISSYLNEKKEKKKVKP